MYGWRARIGLIVPLDNAVIEPELYGLGLDGVSFHSSRLTTVARDLMPTQGVELARSLPELGVDAIVYACAETSFLGGIDANQSIIERIEEVAGVPAITATWAMTMALRHLQASRIALLTPYTAARGTVMEEFLRCNEMAVVSRIHHEFRSDPDERREWYETNLQPAHVAYRLARTLDASNADAVLISATNFRTLDVLDALERDLGRPVVSCNQAILWWCLDRLGIQMDISSAGSLLRCPR